MSMENTFSSATSWEEIRLQGKIKMVDLANSIVELDCE